jgi:small subunit ribosomal protein S13
MSTPQEFRHLVRMGGKDLDGTKKLVSALSDIKGVGDNFSAAVVKRMGADPNVRLGTLTEEQTRSIEKSLQDATVSSLPRWYYNRRNDPDTGETKQLLHSDLEFAVKNDIEDERNIQSWKGVRHTLGLKVRGQRTRTTGRGGKTVGVRKAVLQAAAKAAASSKEEK